MCVPNEATSFVEGGPAGVQLPAALQSVLEALLQLVTAKAGLPYASSNPATKPATT